MTKQKALLVLPLLIIAGLLLHSWSVFLFTNALAIWQNYLALALFLPLPYLFIRHFRTSVLATGLYLLLATSTLMSLTPGRTTNVFGIGPIQTPPFSALSLWLLILYLVLNHDILLNMYLDHKETKRSEQNVS